MAQSAFLDATWDKLLIAVDAKCGEIYWAVYEYNQEGNLILSSPETLCKPESIPKLITADGYGIGDGWGQYHSELTMRLGFKPRNINESQLPHAKALLHLAKIKYDKGEFTSITEALPNYFR